MYLGHETCVPTYKTSRQIMSLYQLEENCIGHPKAKIVNTHILGVWKTDQKIHFYQNAKTNLY